MCLQCGCGLSDEDWGNKDNITLSDIKKSVATPEAKGMTTDEAIKEIMYNWDNNVSKQDKSYRASKLTPGEKTVGQNIRAELKTGKSKKEALKNALSKSRLSSYLSRNKLV